MNRVLMELIAEAKGLANNGDDCNQVGHNWEADGGRSCPKDYYDCSQPVFRCTRCGEYDYGEVGGPGHTNCFVDCRRDIYVMEEDDKKNR